MKKTISFVLAILMMVFALETPASAKVYSGTCGEHVTWSLDTNTGVLTLSGYGDMKNGTIDAKSYGTITKIVIGDSITNISEGAFWRYSNVKEVVIGKSVKYIGGCAFEACSNLQSISIPGNVKKIYYQAFEDCTSLKPVVLNEGVVEIGNSIFSGCSSLETIKIPDSIESFYTTDLNTTALYKNSKNWDYGENYKVLYIDDCAIDAETTDANKVDVVIRDGTRVLGWVAFDNHNITSIYLPSSVKKIMSDAIVNCDKMKNLTVLNPSCKFCANAIYGTGLTIIGFVDSTAYNYAKNNWLDFQCLQHEFKTVITKASVTSNGQIKSVCRGCGKVQSKAIIYYPKTFKLSTKTYTYNGKAKTPKVTVFDSKGKQISSSNYTVKYLNNKNVGVATVYVVFKGNYSETKKLQFTIIPASTAIQKANSPLKTGIYVQWKKVGNITGYEVQVSASSSFAVGKKNRLKQNYFKLKKLKSKKIYYVRVRTYKVVNGKPYYSLWSKTSKLRIK